VNDLPEPHVAYGAGPEPDAPDAIDRDLLVERVVASYDLLMHHVATAHVSEFVGVGVTMSQAKVLYLVQAEPDIRMSDLAGRMGVTLPSMSGVVDRLVDQGLLTRRDDPSDRRQALVHISDAGAHQLEAFRELNARQVRALLHRLATADLAVVARAIDVLATAAAEAAVDAADPSSTYLTASPTTTTGGNPS
jgi:DNA-binding MarR family transcriptional regulator